MIGVSEELIRQRSYEIWLRDGCPHGLDVRHWLDARLELEAGLGAAYLPSPDFEWNTLVLPRPKITQLPRKRLSHRIAGQSAV